MADDEYVGRRFFRILLPGFSSKLLIPHDFGEHIIKTKAREMTTLVSPNGKIWHVEVYMENKGMYYMGGEGWGNLVKSNNLEVGYLLVLRYRGNMVLSFKVFDLSTWEKDGPSVSKKGMNKKRSGNGIESSKLISETTTVSEKKTRGQRLNSSTSSGVKVEAVEEKTWRDDDGKVHFETIMKPSNFAGCFMHIPAEFKTCTGLSSEHREITVTDPSGTSWLLGLVHMNQNRQTRISKGWRRFSSCNHLNMGDRLSFELVPSTQESDNLIHLRMYKL